MGLPPTNCDDSGANADQNGERQETLPSDVLNADKKRSSALVFGNDSIWAKIAYSTIFQNTTLVVIVFNAIWIGIDVQANHPNFKKAKPIGNGTDKLPLEPYSTVVEQLFCAYFFTELVVRFLAFRRKLDCFKDNWFVFDGILVFFMVLENWALPIIGLITGTGSDGLLSKFSALRLMRLLRLTRMTRIIREFPELVTLLKGMISATKAVSFILLFLLLCMYVFAIIFTAQLGDPKAPELSYKTQYWNTDHDPTANELFGSLGDSMMTLFTRGMLQDNLAETLQAIKDRGGDIECSATKDADGKYDNTGDDAPCERTGGSLALFWVFICFMIISAFCLLNMLIGVLCEVIDDSAAQEAESTQISELRKNMATAFHVIDTSQDGLITATEWAKMKKEPTVRASMANLGVEDQHMEDRLNQMQESLFGGLDEGEEEEEPSDDVLPVGAKVDDNRQGLTFDEFITKVVEIRPDTPASALDIEILRVRVEREEKNLNARLDFIEQALATVNASDGPPPTNAKPTSNQSVKVVEDSKLSSSTSWLRDVPTEVLFAVLNSRTPPTAKLLADSR